MEHADGEMQALQGALGDEVRRMKSAFNFSISHSECRTLEALVDFAQRTSQAMATSPLGPRVALEASLSALRIGHGALATGDRVALARRKAGLLEAVLAKTPARACGVRMWPGGRKP